MHRRVFALLLCLLLLAVSVTAVAAGPEDTWKITVPAAGAKVTGPDVTLTVDPGLIKVKAPGAVVAGEGHWHFFVDGKEVGKGPVNTFTFKNLTPGQHVLRVELHQGDHSVYPNDKGREVTIQVSLPNTGAGVLGYAAGGGLLLAMGGMLLRRRRSV
jgi:LPXTG-motif cell wall-anchored protein